MQKVLTKAEVKMYKKGKSKNSKEISGNVTKLEDVINYHTPLEIYEALDLFYKKLGFSKKDYSCYVLRFPLNAESQINIQDNSSVKTYELINPIQVPEESEIYEVTNSGLELMKFFYEEGKFTPAF